MQIGVAYHAERWPESSWAADADLMGQFGVDVVILGEYSWCRLEPRRDRFHLDWLADCIKAMADKGLGVIIAPPTCAPPPWLYERHPSLLPRDENHLSWWMGGTAYVCVNSAPYRKYVRRLLQRMVERFRTNHSIVGWLLDAGPAARYSLRCYCDHCVREFRSWLKRKYGTIGRLNELWGTSFWGMEFTDWHEVPAPRRTPMGPLPAMQCDWRRFVSASARSFVKEQQELLSRSSVKTVVAAGWNSTRSPAVDLYSLGAETDVAAVGLGTRSEGLDTDIPHIENPFWVVDAPAGLRQFAGNIREYPRKGQVRLNMLKYWAAGAEMIAFSRWRTCPYGQQFYEEGLVDADGQIKDKFEEVRQAAGDIHALAEKAGKTTVNNEVAIILDFDWIWSVNAPVIHDALSVTELLRNFASGFRSLGAGVDIVAKSAELERYKVVVLPMPTMVERPLVERLSAWVYRGGILALSPLAGSRTVNNNRIESKPPGLLSELAGLEVTALSGLNEQGVEVTAEENTIMGRGCFICEKINPKGAAVIARFSQGPFAGEAAICRNASGSGKVFYVAAVPDCRLTPNVCKLLASESETAVAENLPPKVDYIRAADEKGRPLVMITNNSCSTVELNIPPGKSRWKDLITGRQFTGKVGIDSMEAVILA